VAGARESFGALDIAVNTIGALADVRNDANAACRALYIAMRSELPAIVASGGGVMVNAAATPLGRHAEESHCIIGLSRAAALEHLDEGVRVTAVVTSSGSPADFAAIAVWLCSDRASHVDHPNGPRTCRDAGAGRANWWIPRWLDRIVPRFDPDAVAPEAVSIRERPAEA
jgi:hypothetical protein